MPKGSVDYLDGWKACKDKFEEKTKRLQGRVAFLEEVISSHNRELEKLCDNKSKCGYAAYNRSCPNCPLDFTVEV